MPAWLSCRCPGRNYIETKTKIHRRLCQLREDKKKKKKPASDNLVELSSCAHVWLEIDPCKLWWFLYWVIRSSAYINILHANWMGIRLTPVLGNLSMPICKTSRERGRLRINIRLCRFECIIYFLEFRHRHCLIETFPIEYQAQTDSIWALLFLWLCIIKYTWYNSAADDMVGLV